MITAIVFVKADVAQIPEVAEAIADLEGVSEVYSVTGQIDLIALVRVRQHDDVADVVADRLNKVPGVTPPRPTSPSAPTRGTTSSPPSRSASTDVAAGRGTDRSQVSGNLRISRPARIGCLVGHLRRDSSCSVPAVDLLLARARHSAGRGGAPGGSFAGRATIGSSRPTKMVERTGNTRVPRSVTPPLRAARQRQ